ncbi:MAG: thiamine phosphate synthase [Alphaproteobacteria bacterium]|nr:thiamine phosphate synthase [Alphaproteobacteria bacterium]
MTRCRLYLITPPVLPPDFEDAFARALGAGDVACVQLRLKGADDATILRAAEALMPLALDKEAAFLINDRPDLVLRCGADGAHVGQSDMPYAQARALLGPDRIVGVTCHDSRHLAMEAGEAGADYVAFGAFYPTATKDAPTQAAPELLEWWAQLMEVPCVAIGGITPDNAEPLVRAGADFLAVSAGVWAHPEGPAAAVRAFDALFDRVAEG